MADLQDIDNELLDEERQSFLIFRIDTSWYALPSTCVKKVLPYTPITFIPGCPEYVLGIIHIRGDIESVIDLRSVFGLGKIKENKNARILITESKSLKTGVMVDHVDDITDIPVSQIGEVLSTLPDRIKTLAKGEFPFREHQTIIIDVEALSGAIAGKSA